MTPRTLILLSAGTNCDQELAHAFRLAGAEVDALHIHHVIERPQVLADYDLLGLPGGFSYGDDIAAGRIYANLLRHRLYPALRKFIQSGKPVIGICNGFQILVKAALLPGFDWPDDPPPQTATLADNESMRFIDRWVPLRVEPNSVCLWTRGLEEFDLPIAHGEGRFMAPPAVLDRLEAAGQVALRYVDNPNGSQRHIAGICDPTGRVFGLMPHPERFTRVEHHPHWTRRVLTEPAGLRLFVNAVDHVRHNASAPAGGMSRAAVGLSD